MTGEDYAPQESQAKEARWNATELKLEAGESCILRKGVWYLVKAKERRDF